MRKWVSALAGASAVLITAGCNNPLDVQNKNNPDVERAFSTPASVEQIIGTTFQLIYQAHQNTNTSIQPQLFNMAFESYASVANFGMATRAALPRQPILNYRGNQTANENYRDFANLTRAVRLAASGVANLDRLVKAGRTTATAARDSRDRMFSLFTNGVGLGELALAYDSAAIVTPATPDKEVPPLSAAKDVMVAALALLDSAQAEAAKATGQTLPSTWINGLGMTTADFVRFVRSYRARLRAGCGRLEPGRARKGSSCPTA